LGNTDSLIVIDGKGCSTSGRVMISSIANPVCYTANTNTCLPTPVVTCPVGTPCIKDIVDDFGADPTGSINSDCAFASATDFFNNRGGEGILTIPPGTYIVGKQSYHARPLDPSYPFGLTGRDIFCFTNCNNLIIRGKIAASPPIIKFDDCLKYGMFDESFQERYLTQWMANSVSDYYRLATTGSFLVLNNCENITIESLIVDGNSDNYIYGGSYSDGIQIPSNGIEIHSSNDITINGVYIHHFGLEGILIADELNLNPTTFAINIFNSKFNWNGRDGIYFKGGSGVNAINCQFNYNAMTRYGMGNGAGMSFEYNGGYLPSNSTFINCEFKFNQRYGILCAPPDQFQPYNASNFTFKECEIVSAEYNLSGNGIASHAASLYGPQFHFRKCNFYGQCIQGFQEVNAHRDWGLEFTEDASITLSHIGCGFYEDYNNFSHNSSLLDECNTGLLNSGPISYLVELGPIGKALFRYAKIISNKQLKLMHMTGGTQPLNKILFENSEIRNYGLNGPDRTLGSLVNHIQRNTYYKFVDPALFNGVYFVMYAQPTLDQNYVFRTLTPANCLPKYRNPIYPNAVTNVCVCNSCNPITLPYSCPSDCDPCLDARISFESEEMNEKDEIILNPNPVVNMLLISNLSSGKNIFCYNSVGQCIFTNTSTSNYFEINLSNLQSGMYLIKVDGKKSQRFIKLQEQ
ncbi:MAG TPA: T9SS type A sorting domain-containing protein, partial [Bacteroidia bacterium]|nr:T9SS type A sorting domain-containing protein [Bacteroidia bacterium]